MTEEQKTKTLRKMEDFHDAYGNQSPEFETFIRRIEESNISLHELAYWYWDLLEENKKNKRIINRLERASMRAFDPSGITKKW